MGLSVVTYALCKKYTDETASQFGGLKGAPCKVKSVIKDDGRSTITLEWKNDAGETRESEVYVDDGMRPWIAGNEYSVGDIVIYDNMIYLCLQDNTDSSWVKSHQQAIGGSCDYYIVDRASSLPTDLTSSERKIYFCIADSTFRLWDGTKWSTIDAGIKAVELTQAEYNALPRSEKLNGTIYFVTDAPGGGGGSGELTQDLTVVKAVGGISIGTEYTEGTSLEQIFRDMLAPTMYPTLTNPSASLTATGAKLLESGASLNTTMTVAFNRGSINPAYGTSGYRAGAASDYSLNGGTAQASNTFDVTVTSAQKTYQATVNYAAGEQPKDSSGADYSTPLAAGSVNSNTITYEFVDALWANTANIAAVAKLALISKNTKQKDFVFPAQTVANPEIFDVPASQTVTAVQVKNDLSGAYEDAADQFTITTVSHDDAAGNAVSYNRYTFNLGYDTGSRTVRIKWS